MAALDLHALARAPFYGPRQWPKLTPAEVRKAKADRVAAAVVLAAQQLPLALGLTQPVVVEQPPVEAIEPSPPADPAFDAVRAAALFAWAQRVGGPGAQSYTDAFEDLLLVDTEVASHVIWQRRGRMVRLLVTRTPLGYTAGYHYDAPSGGAYEGGGLEPSWDQDGAFYWDTLDAAYHAAARGLIAAAGADDQTTARCRSFLVDRGLDADREPDPALQRRFVSRDAIACATRPLGSYKPEPTPTPSEARRAFERAQGLTDVHLALPGPVPAPAQSSRLRAVPPCERLTALVSAAGVGPRGSAVDRDLVLAALHGAAPPGASSPVDEVLRVFRARTGLGTVTARLRLADGTVGKLKVERSGRPDETVQWMDLRPHRWDADASAWVSRDAEREPDAVDRVVAAGMSPNRFIALLGALQDPDHPSPYRPRSTGFPVALVNRSNGWELHLSTPACGSIAFVRRVAEAAGIEPVWRPDHDGASHGMWHHAVDLATDADWQQLAETMEHTLPQCVERAVGLSIMRGSLTPSNARQLLAAVDVQAPEGREVIGLTTDLGNTGLPGYLDVWSAIHAVEDGLVTPGTKKNYGQATLTAAGWRHIGQEPPPPVPSRARKRERAGGPNP